jgi:spore germination protein KC
MLRRRLTALLLILLAALPLTGCWDRRELEEEAFVLAIGVDPGRQSQFAVTAAIALPANMAGGGKGGGGNGPPFMLTTVEAPTVVGAMAMMAGYVDRRISLTHTKALFMGEAMARISGMHTMDEFTRFRETRRSVYFIVTRGPASDFMHAMNPVLEKDPQRFIEQMTYNYRLNGMLPVISQIHSFLTAVNTGYASPLTYYAAINEGGGGQGGGQGDGQSARAEGRFTSGELPRTGGPNIEMLGAAVFKGARMVGVLTGDDMRLTLMAQDRFLHGLFSVPDPADPNLFLSLDMRRGRGINVDVDLSGQRPRVTGLITLEAELLAIQSNINYTEPDRQVVLERYVADNLRKGIARVIAQSQQWETDVAALGRRVVTRFPTVEQWNAYDWPRRYPEAEVNFDVQVRLRRFGLQLSPPRSNE